MTQLPCLLTLLFTVQRASALGAIEQFPPTIGWFNTTLDNFGFDGRSFPLKYLVYDAFWKPSGPILFYLGNEGQVEDFYNNTGVVFEWAPKLGALVLFCEHRYYGASLPFGSESLKPENLRFLSVEQALADYAVFITWFRSQRGCSEEGCRALVLGGSYGGMLAAWFRRQYPHLCSGALAASAPVDLYPGEGKQSLFWEATKNTFERYGAAGCGELLDQAFRFLAEAGKREDGHEYLSRIFQTCSALETGEVSIARLDLYLRGAVSTLAMVDYPVASDFVTQLPAHPVALVCARRPSPASAAQVLAWLDDVTNLLLNGTGQLPCHDTDAELLSAKPRNDIDMLAWNYQACTELILEPLTSDGHAFFTPGDDQLSAVVRACRERFGVEPRPEWLPISTGRSDYSSISNIIFSNGEKDPWRVGVPGPKKLSSTVTTLMIEGAAHHEDLRFDPPLSVANPAVQAAKAKELELVRSWLLPDDGWNHLHV